jgi:hypothetical protein
MIVRLIGGSLILGSAVVTAAPLAAQQDLPLAPVPGVGLHVSPWFEGWYQNPDGTFTLSFGYYNRNEEEAIDIPLGEDNRIEPAEFDGGQPTTFGPGRERGVFAVTVPGEYADRDVVWTLRNRDGTYSVPGRVTSTAYDLGIMSSDGEGNFVFPPMAEGSVPPALSLSETGPIGRGPGGIASDQSLTARVGSPLTVAVWVDDSASRREPVPLNVTWSKHVGPGAVEFQPGSSRAIPISTREASTAVTFSAPGEYVLRARADNHAQRDSRPGEQCCWTNGFIRVTVTP